jgi:hypothetical protein
MTTVFIYDDGQVGVRDLPPSFAQNYSYREAVMEPLKATWEPHSPVMLHQPRYVEWFRRSRMYDGRPIFAAHRFAVKEVAVSEFITRIEIERGAGDVKSRFRASVRAFIARNAPQSILLDEQFMVDLPVEPGMEAQQIEHWGMQALFAVPV